MPGGPIPVAPREGAHPAPGPLDAMPLVTLVVLAPLLTTVMWAHPDLWGTDRFFNEIRVVALGRCWEDGALLPRWLPDLAHGHGYPLFHYYPPLLYALATPLYLGGLDPRVALLTVLTAALAAGALAVASALRDRHGPLAAWLAGALWLATPYLQVDLQVRHAWAELLGLCLLPVALGGFWDLAEGRRGASPWLRAVLGLAAVVLAHNVVALFAAAGAALLALVVGTATPGRAGLRRSVVAGALALGLSAWFWLPALLDRSLVRVDAMSVGVYALASHVVYPSQLVGVGFGRGPSVPGPDDAMSLSMGLAHALALLALLALALRRPRRPGRAAWLLLASAVALVLLVLPFAAPLLEALPLASHVQAPFRLLGPLGLVVAWAVPLAAWRLLPARALRPAAALLGMAALLLIVPALTAPRAMTADEWAVYQPVRDDGAAGLRRLPDPYATTAGFQEYLPRAVRAYATEPTPPTDGPPWIAVASTEERCRTLTVRGTAERPGALRLNTFDFPGFEVRLDGRPIPHRTAPELGFVEAAVPRAGPFTLTLERGPTPAAEAGLALSVLTLLAGLLGAVGRLRRRA